MKPIKIKQKATPKTPAERKAAQFQKLIKEIDDLQSSLQSLQKELEKGRKCYFETISPLHKEQQQVCYDTCLQIAHWMERSAFRKREKEVLTFMVLDLAHSLLESDFFKGNPDQEAQTIQIYNTYAPYTWQEIKMEQGQDYVNETKALFEMLGIEVELDPDDDPATILEKTTQFLENKKAQETEKEEEKKTRKKTEKQQAKEEKAKEQEQIVYKSLKTIYYNLVKLLHPDLEPDEAIRAEKNAAIQQVNSAYESKDLYALLRFQSEYLHTHTGALQQSDEKQMAGYIHILKEQKEALLMELDMFMLSSPYDNWIFDNLCSDRGKGELIRKKRIQEEKEVLKSYQARYAASRTLDSLNEFIKDMKLSYDFEGDPFIEIVGKRASSRKKR